MQKRKFWEIVLQWILPCALLIVALVLSINEFNNKMNTVIRTIVDDQAEQIGFYYSAGVDDKLGALGTLQVPWLLLWRDAPTEAMLLYMRSWIPS